MMRPNTSEGVEPLVLIAYQNLNDEILKESCPKVPLPIKRVFGEGLYEDDQATSDTSLKCDEFELTCNESIEIFNELMSPRSATRCYEALPKIFNNSYTFKRRWAISTLGVFKPKNAKSHAKLTSRDFNPKDLRANPSQLGEVDTYRIR